MGTARSRWFFDDEVDSADDRADSEGAVPSQQGQKGTIADNPQRSPLVAVVEGTKDWALIANGKIYLTGGEGYANCGWPASLEHLLEALPALPCLSIRIGDLPENWTWQRDVLPRISDMRNDSQPEKAT